MRVHRCECCQIPRSNIAPPSFPNDDSYLGKLNRAIRNTALIERLRQQIELRALARAVYPFDGDEFSARGHFQVVNTAMHIPLRVYLVGKTRRNVAVMHPSFTRIAHDKIAPCPSHCTLSKQISFASTRVSTRAAEKSGRHAKDITLIAATKTQLPNPSAWRYDSGIRHFGENRVQEWEAKRAASRRPRRHLAPHRPFADTTKLPAPCAFSIPWIRSIRCLSLAESIEIPQNDEALTSPHRNSHGPSGLKNRPRPGSSARNGRRDPLDAASRIARPDVRSTIFRRPRSGPGLFSPFARIARRT